MIRQREAWRVSNDFDPSRYSKEELGDTSALIPANIRALFENIVDKNQGKRIRETTSYGDLDGFYQALLDDERFSFNQAASVQNQSDVDNFDTDQVSYKEFKSILSEFGLQDGKDYISPDDGINFWFFEDPICVEEYFDREANRGEDDWDGFEEMPEGVSFTVSIY